MCGLGYGGRRRAQARSILHPPRLLSCSRCSGDDQIHWFSIINSLAIVLLLTGIVAMIMMRTLRRDVNR
jgi:hypothetical protein